MRTYEAFYLTDDPAPATPDTLLARRVYDGLRRTLPDATIRSVGIAERFNDRRGVVIVADIPDRRPMIDEDDDPALERVAAALARILHLPERPGVAVYLDGGRAVASCHVTVGEVAA